MSGIFDESDEAISSLHLRTLLIKMFLAGAISMYLASDIASRLEEMVVTGASKKERTEEQTDAVITDTVKECQLVLKRGNLDCRPN